MQTSKEKGLSLFPALLAVGILAVLAGAGNGMLTNLRNGGEDERIAREMETLLAAAHDYARAHWRSLKFKQEERYAAWNNERQRVLFTGHTDDLGGAGEYLARKRLFIEDLDFFLPAGHSIERVPCSYCSAVLCVRAPLHGYFYEVYLFDAALASAAYSDSRLYAAVRLTGYAEANEREEQAKRLQRIARRARDGKWIFTAPPASENDPAGLAARFAATRFTLPCPNQAAAFLPDNPARLSAALISPQNQPLSWEAFTAAP